MKYRFINVYIVRRCKGGSEEGGWYYDAGEIQKIMPVLVSNADALLSKVRAWCARRNEGTRPRSSVIGTPDWCCSLSSKPGMNYPKERPYYE